MNKTISVIIRTMPGRERFLDKCIFLLSGQSYSNIEVIVVAQKLSEDATSSKIQAVVDRWADRFESAQLITHVSSTDARARSLNLGKKAATGRYIAFLDDDDKVYPNHYEKLIASLEASDYAWAYADIIRALYNEFGQLVSRTSPFRRVGYSYLDHLRGNFIPIHSFVIDLHRATDVGEVDEAMSRNEDYEFILRLAFRHEPLYVPGFGAEYCIRSDGSNTVSDGTLTARQSFQKRRIWNDAQAVLDDKKLHNFGWWVRELDRLPPVNPHDPSLSGIHHVAAEADLRHAVRYEHTDHTFRNLLRFYYSSKSWRYTRPIRNAIARVRHHPMLEDIIPHSEESAKHIIGQVITSTSWEITMPLRMAGRIARRISGRI
ncbi:glycosyltransferase family 2 protein [Caballeronia insecticola]|uniref:glycosyltransferase family 2 protein n=1 Tax=Caballeronia insecticola TaxID=758793 RepID=UPI000687B239|nr:glycosyltransferase [Caballeronia insecticola]